MAVGGLRNTAESFSRLAYVAEYGMALGLKSKATLDRNPAWIDTACEAIGANDEERKKAGLEPIRPPADAIAAIRRLLTEHTATTMPPNNTARRTNVDAHLLEGWRAGAKDPEHQMFTWLTQ